MFRENLRFVGWDVDVHVLRLGEKCTLSGTTPEPPRSLVAAFDGVSCAAPPHVGWVCDAAAVAPAQQAAANSINELVGDLATHSERHGVVDRDSGDFEFVPDRFPGAAGRVATVSWSWRGSWRTRRCCARSWRREGVLHRRGE